MPYALESKTLQIEKTFQELPNWTFWVNEISAGVYNVKGRGRIFGANLGLTGEDPERLLNKARRVAYIREALAVDEHLLGELVVQTRTVNIDAAKRLAAMLDDYFRKPWNVRELGEGKTAVLGEQIHRY